MGASIPRPGVQVVQKFRTTNPTILTPTLVPCVVGVCEQIVDAVTRTSAGAASINTEALIQLPGGFVALAAPGSPPAYTTLDGKVLSLSIKNGAAVDITFAGVSLSPKKVVAEIAAAFATAGVTEATAKVVGTSAFSLETVGKGEFETIEVLAATDVEVLAAFGIGKGKVYQGSGTYEQCITDVPLSSFPDPRGNISEVTIDPDTVKVYLQQGGSSINFREASRSSSYLRRGATNTIATITGSVDLSGLTYGPGGSLDGQSATWLFDGSTYTTDFDSTLASETDVVARINATIGLPATALDGTNQLVWTSQKRGYSSIVTAVSGAALTTLGFTAGDTDRGVSAVAAVDDGNGDGVTPLLKLNGATLTAAATAGTVTGSQTITGGVTDGLTLELGDGYRAQTLTFDGAANAAAVLAQCEALFGVAAGGRLAFTNSANKLKIDSLYSGDEGVVKVLGGTALYALGLTPEITGTLDLDAIADATTLNTLTLIVEIDGTNYTTTFAGLLLADTGATIAAQVNTALGTAGSAAVTAAKYLYLRSKTGGAGATMSIVGGTALTILGLTVGDSGYTGVYRGTEYPPLPGDELWVDGTYFARILQVAPGGAVDRVKIDKQIAINGGVGLSWYMVAKGLPAVSRPEPELVVSGDGSYQLKHELLRDSLGAPTSTGRATIYMSYQAIRRDVTALAKNASLLRFNDTTDVASLVSPVDARNPFALGLQFALLHAPGTQVTGIGVDAKAADAPYGTVEAFTRAAEFLEGCEVYGIAPLTQDQSVFQVFLTHVLAMSDPEQRGERIVVVNTATPTSKVDTLVASGYGNTVGSTGVQFETGVANLSALLVAKSVDPSGILSVEDGVFIDIASDSKHYSVLSISGSVITIRTSFTAGQNDDAFYATTDFNDAPLPSQLINEPFTVKIRGASLTLPDGRPDKDGMAETIANISASYGSRRLWNTFPGTCAAPVNGIETILPGFYMSAAVVGMIAQQAPSQSFTNMPMTSFTQVIGSNGYFSEKQLDRIAGGGTWTIIQEGQGTALFSRQALTSDASTVETRTDSITKVVDYTSKFVRRGLRGYIGRFNISQGFLDSLSHVGQGLLSFLVDAGTLLSGDLTSIVQDEASPDTVLMEMQIGPPYPCNYIRITLVI